MQCCSQMPFSTSPLISASACTYYHHPQTLPDLEDLLWQMSAEGLGWSSSQPKWGGENRTKKERNSTKEIFIVLHTGDGLSGKQHMWPVPMEKQGHF